ncbi:hypothetical protein [Paracoccus sp. SY]|uniref:hypothetical protein n=1 Tax=Paracoccus sp. SY TaxID=1330255 RepID=UPI000CD1613C|nr:hypothetical protein [Paracoccus sp. SY]
MTAAAILAAAFTACMPYADAYEAMEKEGKARIMAGLNGKGNITEVWANPKGAWTAFVTTPEGTSCPLDWGKEGVASYPKPKPGRPA